MNEFDEFQAETVMRICAPQLLSVNSEIEELSRSYESSIEPGERGKAFQKLFAAVIGKWAAGDFVSDEIESWHEFCLQAESGLAELTHANAPPAGAMVVTSAAAIGADVRRALHLSPEDTLEMCWMSRHASFSDFRMSGDRLTLSACNAYPHLDDDSLLTFW
jgi:broad specificity phosphatase PhoE